MNRLSKAVRENKKRRKKERKMKPLQQHKIANIDAMAFNALVHFSPQIGILYNED